ncbi:unnamed protein product, partial [Heterotrigona itama]
NGVHHKLKNQFVSSITLYALIVFVTRRMKYKENTLFNANK